MIASLIRKDIKLFFRNEFFAVVTILGLAAIISVFFLMPAKPNDRLAVAVHISKDVDLQTRKFLAGALEAEMLPSETELVNAVTNGDYQAGLILTGDLIDQMIRGVEVSIPVYAAPGTTPELRQALTDIFSVGFNNLQVGSGLMKVNIENNVTVLGPDFLGIGEPLALRERMFPLLILMILSIELMGLANLISEEIERGTVNALLVTPLKTNQFFFSKALMGIGLAFTEVLVIIIVTGKILVSPDILLISLLAGSLMVTGIAFFIASLARNMMSVLSWSTLFLLILSLPGVSIIFPTLAADWIKTIPSFFLVDILNRTLNYGARWAEIGANLVVLSAFGIVALFCGSWLLKRRFK